MSLVTFLTEHETSIRLLTFLGVMGLMCLLEALLPRRARVQTRLNRWTVNLGLIIIDTLVVRIAIPIIAMGLAATATSKGWGLFNNLDWPVWLEIIFAMIILDMLIYWQHVAFHYVPFLWRFHKVHHADRDIDATTGVRFHPAEIVMSMIYKLGCILLLGPAVAAVLLFEVILNACAMFNHANMRLPLWIDKYLRLILVTPDMHRVHHSVIVKETNSNYGFSISLWDRLFGSYINQPAKGHDDMTIGLEEYQDNRPSYMLWILLVPFQRRERSKQTTNNPS